MQQKTVSASLGVRVTLVGSFANLLLIAAKFAAGLWGHSQALIADAIHSTSDLASDAVVLWGIIKGGQEPDTDHHFGHRRFETMAAALVGVALCLAGVALAWEAAVDLIEGNTSSPTAIAVAAAAFSVLLKEAMYHYTLWAAKKADSPALKANAWHHRTDAFSSLAVLAGVGAAWINPAWGFLDAAVAAIVGVVVLWAGGSFLKDAFNEMTDKAPPREIIKGLEGCARQVTGVLGVHDVKVRTSGGRMLVQLHIDVSDRISVVEGHDLAKEVEKCIHGAFPQVMEVIVHVDPIKDSPAPVAA